MEIPFENVTLAQKEMILRCNTKGKPVIVATQMLESMQTNPRPTRAEVSDVTNAVLDGADAVMLSGESANGSYPVASTEALWSIVHQADIFLAKKKQGSRSAPVKAVQTQSHSMDSIEALAYSAVKASKEMKAKCIIVMTRTGTAVKHISKFRPDVPIVAYLDVATTNAKIGRQLMLHRGVHPFVHTQNVRGTPEDAIAQASSLGFCEKGDTVLVITTVEAGMSSGGDKKYNVALRIGSVD